jgi:hypothetical protein
MPKSKKKSATADLDVLLDELEQSGLSVAAFARDRGVPTWRLYEGRRRRQRKAASDKSDSRPASQFLPIQLAPEPTSGEAFEVELRGGRTVRVPSGFDEACLRRLVRALESC